MHAGADEALHPSRPTTSQPDVSQINQACGVDDIAHRPVSLSILLILITRKI